MNHGQVLTLVAQCGRGTPTWASGRLGVVWDDEAEPVSAMVGPGNVVAGTFRVAWAAGAPAEEIAASYIDPDRDWQRETVRCAMPGVSSPKSSLAITLAGVTSRGQAEAECRLQAARQLYHRRRLSWEMAAEGLLIARGDVVYLTHGMIDGGAAGRLRAVEDTDSGARLLVRPVEPFPQPAAAADHLLVRLPDGALHDARIAVFAADRSWAVLTAPLPASEGRDIDILWRLYSASAPPSKVRIVATRPVSAERVQLEAIDEDPRYHAAASEPLAPRPATPARTPRVLAGFISERLLPAAGGYIVELTLTLTVAGDWRSATVLARAGDGEPWRHVAALDGGATQASWFPARAATLYVRVLPGSAAAPVGPAWNAPPYSIVGVAAPPAAPSNFLIDVLGDGTRRFRWTPPPDPDVVGYELRYSEQTAPAWDAMTPLHAGLLTSSPYETVDPRAGTWRFALRARDAAGNLSDPVWISADLPDTRAGGRFWWDCPSADGWPGTIAGGVRSNDGSDALEGVGDYDWADLTDWAAWRSWGAGDGTQAGRAMTYTPPPVDLRAALPFTLDWQAESVGTVAFEVRTGGAAAAPVWGAWAAYANRRLLTARHVQVRWRLTGDGTQVLSLDHVCWQALGTADTEQVLDSNTANWAGSAAAGRVVPLDRLALVTGLAVTLQNVGAGWNWELLNKTEPRIRIYNGNGATRDATVDVIAYGVARQTGDSA